MLQRQPDKGTESELTYSVFAIGSEEVQSPQLRRHHISSAEFNDICSAGKSVSYFTSQPVNVLGSAAVSLVSLNGLTSSIRIILPYI